jgi:hypothetical protein
MQDRWGRWLRDGELESDDLAPECEPMTGDSPRKLQPIVISASPSGLPQRHSFLLPAGEKL